MTKTENAKTITVYLDDEVRERLKAMAEKIGVSRNRMALNLLIIGLDEAEFLREFVQLVAIARNLGERIRSRISGTGSKEKPTDVWVKPEKAHKTMTIYLDNTLLERLNKMAEVSGVNRNRLIGNLLIMGLEEAETLRRMGIIEVVVFARDLRERVRNRIKGSAKKA